MELLKHYPLNADNREVYHKPTRYTWIKNKWHARTGEPIRIDQRGYHCNIWKRDPFKAWENRGLEPTITYHGLDFLVAYHLAMLPQAPCE